MRAPGAATGMTCSRSRSTSSPYEANVDPLELRIRNYSDKDGLHDLPYTSKALMSAYREGAARFGWAQRSQAPRSMKDGTELVGWGMATGIWEAMMMETAASATLGANGHLEVASATSDIGPGTYTMMTQVASETLGIPVESITAKLGDSDLPKAPVEGGSAAAASVGAAVRWHAAASPRSCSRPQESGRQGARQGQSSTTSSSSTARSGSSRIRRVRSATARSCALRRDNRSRQRRRRSRSTTARRPATPTRRSSPRSRSIEDLGVVRVTRLVCAVAAGRIINPQTARSQIIGGAVMGIGMALHEESVRTIGLAAS